MTEVREDLQTLRHDRVQLFISQSGDRSCAGLVDTSRRAVIILDILKDWSTWFAQAILDSTP